MHFGVIRGKNYVLWWLFSYVSMFDSVIEANSVNSFKNQIDKYWNNFELKYNWKADVTEPEAVVKVF